MTKEPTSGEADLFEAVGDGADDTVVRLLRAGVSAEATDEDGETVLYRAAVSDAPGVVRLLLTAGADPNRASGREGWDLPLCGAACGGHTEVVRTLLTAGARPDSREAFDLTPVVWAVRQGFADTVEALLEYGADPDLPGPGGESPLLLAARHGSPSTVRVLLRYGASAHAEALAEARRWMALDVERELRDGLARAYGDGYETVVRRIEEDGSVTVVVELLRDGAPVAGQEQRTGHAAVATILEAELGLVTPYEELAERALSSGDPGRDDWVESVSALWRRGDEETFEEAALWCASEEPLRQAFGADVLARLGAVDGPSPFTERAVPLLRELSRRAVEPELVRAVVVGLGQHADPVALPEILRHTGHPDTGVRRRAALALTGLVPGGHRDGVWALILLSRDADASVRDRAVLALADVDADSHEIREALAARLNDPDAETAAKAARGLAVRQDPRAIDALARILADEDPDGYARETAADAVRYVHEGPERRRLERTLPRHR
ncbi:ankyrin repeat domain-containing protein [Streptomyces sp. NBC_00872]|uniref:ankyrin repeat domain-containing protein n=1 Tax=Streptomyces sp. NBC_00872 TaxID=2903686 RepID=UPI0038644B3E|nr:ankyrin repeat domain-containing protein [Streptomyces sp. NBC_00872]